MYTTEISKDMIPISSLLHIKNINEGKSLLKLLWNELIKKGIETLVRRF